MAKTYTDLYLAICDFTNLRRAYYTAIRGKGCRKGISSFQTRLESNLWELSHRLTNETYTFGPYHEFYVFEPKKRKIESAKFPDKIIHHCLFKTLYQIFDPKFYEHSYACRIDKGHHKAMLKLYSWVKGNPNKYFLKCDIKKYFQSVDRKVLLSILERNIKDEKFMRCLEKLIADAPGEVGIPIGNLTSQIFANLYLNELDQYIKRKLHVKHYIRYMDDFILLLDSHEDAKRHLGLIRTFCADYLKLELAPHKVLIGKNTQGVGFLGFIIKPWKISMRGKFFRNMRKKIKQAQHKELRMGSFTRYVPSPLMAVIHSYRGHMQYCTNHESLDLFFLEQIKFIIESGLEDTNESGGDDYNSAAP